MKAADWERRGATMTLAGHRIFVVDVPAAGPARSDPLVVLHGFPTSSFDFHLVLDRLARDRRVILFDMLGFGLSEKPDQPYSVAAQADVAMALTDALGLEDLALLTHDLGDTVGGELLARQLEGTWPVRVTHRVLTNGSIYLEDAHLSDGQRVLLGLPDARLGDGDLHPAAVRAGVAATFSTPTAVEEQILSEHEALIARDGGHLLLPRLIRYIEDRRRDEHRFTGAIEAHPSPLWIVWGADDPIAVPSMVDRLVAARPGTPYTMLHDVGHYPMLEAPYRFASAVTDALR